jgi:YD repeat-containing protein
LSHLSAIFLTLAISFFTGIFNLSAEVTITTTSSKGWTRTTGIDNLGLASSNTLSGNGIPATILTPVWRADGSLEGVSLTIGGETHSASFNPDGTLSSLIAPGLGNILGGHSISNGVETLTVDGVTTESALDGTSQSISGTNVIGRSEVLTTNGGGYKNTTTPAVGAPTETAFNAAAAPTAKTYADNTGHAINYAGELPFEITLARGGAVTLGYSNNSAKDLTSAVWPAVTSGPFTIPSVGVGYGYNRSGNVDALTDPSGTRAINFLNGRTSGTTYTAGFLKGYEIIPGRDTVGRHTGILIIRSGATIHTTAKALNGVSNQITNLASGNITATPQRDGAGRIIGYVWSDGTNSVSQTWARGAGGRINSAESNVPGAPSFVYSIDENSFDAFGRRLKCETAGGTWAYTYGAGGQLSSATHPTLGTFTYQYDGLGRRTDKGTANTTDVLNRTTAWTHNQSKNLTIKAHPDARVWFNGVEIENFTGTHSAAITPPGANGGWVPWETLAVLEGQGEGAGDPAPNPLADPDAKAQKKGAVWVPPTAETFTFDAAGNRQSSAQWDFGWDAKNQLARARTKNHTTAAQGYDITFSYDSEGRRVKKHVVEYQSGTQVSEKIITFVWDNWDLLYERHQLPSGLTLLERRLFSKICG